MSNEPLRRGRAVGSQDTGFRGQDTGANGNINYKL
mgnify:CR=1 FL=1